MRTKATWYWISLIALAAVAACSKLDLGGGDGPIPTPSSSPTTAPSASPTPGACSTPSSSANLVIVAMSNTISPTSAPSYGTINGYAVVQNGSFPAQAGLIDHWINQGVSQAITPKNVLQFANVDSAGALHSAVGFKGDAFPPTPYTFPKPAASPTGTAVSNSSLWSTGRIAAPVSQQCYSQTFTLTPGVYYFGDLDYYNLSNFRDVLIVATPPPLRERRLSRFSIRRRGL